MKADSTVTCADAAASLLAEFALPLSMYFNVDVATSVARAAGEELVEMAGSLTSIVESSRSGKYLLAWKLPSVTKAKLQLAIDVKVAAWKAGVMSQATLDKASDEFQGELLDWYRESGAHQTVAVTYRGTAVPLQVTPESEKFFSRHFGGY